MGRYADLARPLQRKKQMQNRSPNPSSGVTRLTACVQSLSVSAPASSKLLHATVLAAVLACAGSTFAGTPIVVVPALPPPPKPVLAAPPKPAVPADKATLKKAELNQTVFAAPGNITLAAMLTADHPSSTNCSFYANVYTAVDGDNSISTAVGSPTVLTGSLSGLVGPVKADLPHGKYRIDFSVKDEANSACKGSTSANFEVKRMVLPVGQAEPVVNIITVYTELATDKTLKVSGLAATPGTCDKMTVDIDGKKKELTNIKFPWVDFPIPGNDGIYPHVDGKHTLTLTGGSAHCKGSATSVFGTVVDAHISNAFVELSADKTVKLSVLALVPAVCEKMTIDIDGKKKEVGSVKFPLEGYAIPMGDSIYPQTGGKHTLTVTGDSPHCKGTASAVFGTVVAAPPSIGMFSNFAFTNMDSGGVHYLAGQPLQMDIFGSGVCSLDVAISDKKTGAQWTRRVNANFASGKPFHYVGDLNMPKFGHFINAHFLPLGTDDLDKEIDNDNTFVVTVAPASAANAICTGQAKLADYRTHCRDAKGCYPSGGASPAPQAGKAPDAGPAKGNPKSALKGHATGFTVSGFTEGKADGKMTLEGVGTCAIRMSVYDLAVKDRPIRVDSGPNGSASPIAFPFSVSNLGPLKAGKYRADAQAFDKSVCEVQGPLISGSSVGWYFEFQVGNGVSDGKPNGSSGNSGGVPPAGGLPGAPKPATGNITDLQVPGGSFAADETQRLQVSGSGGCAADLRLWNTAYGGNFDNANNPYPVGPLALAASPSLYNGTHFGTLTEGSWTASVTGKNGCTGSKTIDFKVTAKASTSEVKGKPTLSLDQQPQSGGVFKKSKDSNIGFKVSLPPSIKALAGKGVGCCEVEFNYKNSYGGWAVASGSPYSDPSWTNSKTLPSVTTSMSVSGFKVSGEGAMEWRMKVRAYLSKTQFDWSDWLEFKVDQN